MSSPFNPLAGNFSSVGWLAPDDDYNLKVVKVSFAKVGEAQKGVLSFDVAIADGPFENKRPQRIQVWEPESDFSQAARIIVSALGYIPGRDDARFTQENPDIDLTIDSVNDSLGSGYEQLVGSVFTATLSQKASQKYGQVYQQYRNIRPLGA